MRPRDRGTIVQVGSTLAYRGIPLQSAYCGAKHAVQGFTESLRCELLHDHSGIDVTMVQMPAVNTPQFSWVLSRLPHHAQPVPPIYQPEVAARAVLHAADHPRRREYWVGASTAATLLVNKIAPGALDHYLARRGYASQQTAQPRDPDQPVNLWQPADGRRGDDFGAHGRFDRRSAPVSYQAWASRHRRLLAVAIGAAAGAVTVRRLRWVRDGTGDDREELRCGPVAATRVAGTCSTTSCATSNTAGSSGRWPPTTRRWAHRSPRPG
jgi:hypothetical protein